MLDVIGEPRLHGIFHGEVSWPLLLFDGRPARQPGGPSPRPPAGGLWSAWRLPPPRVGGIRGRLPAKPQCLRAPGNCRYAATVRANVLPRSLLGGSGRVAGSVSRAATA